MNDVAIFKVSRKKAVLLLLSSVLFVTIGVWMSSEKPFLGWSCAAFFSLGVITSFLMFRPNSMYLRLDEQGFEMGSFFGKSRTRWCDVDGFAIRSIRGAKMIAIIYSQQYKKQQVARAVASSLAGMEGAIPNSYDAPIDQVMKTLNIWLARFGKNAPSFKHQVQR